MTGSSNRFRGKVLKARILSSFHQMFDALNAPRQLRAVSIYLVSSVVEETTSTTKIPKITDLSHFEYDGSTKARVWRFYGIGEDRQPTFWHLPKEKSSPIEEEPNDRDDDIVQSNSPSSVHATGIQSKSLFYCECGASFIRWSNYLRHLDEGNHKICPEHIKIRDRALGLYMRSIEENITPVPISSLPEGWAMGSGRKTGRYPETTKTFIKKKFDEFAAAGHKLRADVAEGLMRADRFIEPKDWMTRNQLKNYINTLLAEMPKLRVFRRAAEPDEDDDHDFHVEVEVEPQEEDLFFSEKNFHDLLTREFLEKFFHKVDEPI
ncbi:hypothetical protein PMAYCL1PPCAC_05695, partial [Pristionchus mayeri]